MKKIVKIDHYLWTKYDSLLFLGHPVERCSIDTSIWYQVKPVPEIGVRNVETICGASFWTRGVSQA